MQRKSNCYLLACCSCCVHSNCTFERALYMRLELFVAWKRKALMEKDSSLVDWSESQGKGSKRSSAKHRRAQQELKKCLGGETLEEPVIKSYSCAWQRDILVQGRLHLTENWICFYSNILGWETKEGPYNRVYASEHGILLHDLPSQTNISLKDVTFISKQRTALVFPNAILVEAGDRKYGFASFVHRDRTYNVMQLIWQNSQLSQPLSGEDLRNELSHLTWQQKLSSQGTHSKSSSMTGDSSDFDPNSPTQSPSRSVARTSNLSTTILSQVTTASESEWVVDTDEVDVGELYRPGHLELPSSTCSSDAVSVDSSGGSCQTPLEEPDPMSEEEDSFLVNRNKRTLNRSPSLVTLNPLLVETPDRQSDALLGGSPSFLHHWKRTLSVTTLWQTVVTLAKPQHLAHVCSPSILISLLISLFIILLLLSTVSMLCQLSKVEPALKPYLAWQPWCSLC